MYACVHACVCVSVCMYVLGVARYTDVTVRYDFRTTGKKKKSTMLGLFSFILNRQ